MAPDYTGLPGLRPARSLSLDLADMAAAHGEWRQTGLESHLPCAIVFLLEAVHVFDGHKGIAMYAQKALAEFAFKALQGFVEQGLAACIVRRHVLLVGLKAVDVFDPDHLQCGRAGRRSGCVAANLAVRPVARG